MINNFQELSKQSYKATGQIVFTEFLITTTLYNNWNLPNEEMQQRRLIVHLQFNFISEPVYFSRNWLLAFIRIFIHSNHTSYYLENNIFFFLLLPDRIIMTIFSEIVICSNFYFILWDKNSSECAESLKHDVKIENA